MTYGKIDNLFGIMDGGLRESEIKNDPLEKNILFGKDADQSIIYKL